MPIETPSIDVLLGPVAALINRGIHENEAARALCTELDGRTLQIRAQPSPAPLRLACRAGRLELSIADDSDEADARIAGTLIELGRLTFFDHEAPLREGRVDIDGDAEIADRFRALLLAARPDLEARLADWFGQDTARRIAGFAHETRDRVIDVADDLAERAADRLHAEGRFPPPRDIDAHHAAVDEFANDVERLEARLNRLTGTPPE